ncbi:MAG TPA: tyrosine-type recombinase/integrase [Candidatus Obscuribacterales bacterium]
MAIKNGLYMRGNSWYICIKVRGQQIRKAFGKGPEGKAAAEMALGELRKQRAIGNVTNDWSGLEKLTEPRKLKTFEQSAEEYMEERRHYKVSTLTTYREHLKNYLLPEFGKLLISDITEQQIAAFQARLACRLSARRTNSTVNLLRSILKVCVRRKLIEENPANGVDSLREPQANIDPLSIEELNLALDALSPLYKPLFTCLAWTGARPGEMLALRWADIDFIRGEIRINKARVKGAEDLPKTGSSERFIPMLPPVRDCLERLRMTRPTIDPNAYVFVGRNCQPINRHLDATWSAALRKGGLRHRPSYQLRHTFASICLQQGVNPGWVSKVLGHSTLQTTFRHYARFIHDPSKQNERIMAGLFTMPVDKGGAQKGAQPGRSESADSSKAS